MSLEQGEKSFGFVVHEDAGVFKLSAAKALYAHDLRTQKYSG